MSLIFRTWSTVPMHSRLLPTFSSMRFSVAGFMLRSLIHLNLSFMYRNRYASIFILLRVNIHLFVEDAFFFPLYHFSFFVKNQVFIGVWINIWVFYSILLVNISVYMPISIWFFYCISVIELDVRDGNASTSWFIVQYSFGYPVCFFCLLVFPYEVEYCSFKVCEELCWDFDGDCIESIDCFGRISIFTMLILSIQEHGRSFHFLVSSSISFFKDLKFLSNRSFTSLVNVTPRYFTLFVAIVTGNVSLIFLSATLSFVYI